MPIITISEPTAEDITKLVFAKRKRGNNTQDLLDDTKYAIVLLRLHDTVTPGDYPALGAAVTAVPGIQGLNLLFDHQTRPAAEIPANHTQVLHARADITLRDDTPEPE